MRTKSILVLEHNISDFFFMVEELSAFGYSATNFYYCKNLKTLTDPGVAHFSPDFIFAHLNVADSPSPLDTFLYTQNLFPDLPIVVIAGLKDDEVAIKCIELGAENFLEKGSYNGVMLKDVITFSIERNRHKIELEKLKSDYHNLFEENPLPLLVIDNNTSKFHAVNKAAVSKYGYHPGEFKNLSLKDICQNIGECVVESKAEETVSYSSHFNKQGECIYVEVTSVPIVYKDIPSQLITVNDVTAKVLAQEKEKKARQRLDAIFKSTNDAILLADDDGKYIQVNRASCIMLEYTEEELLSLSVANIVVSTQPNQDAAALWKEFLNTGNQRGVIELRTKTGKYIICHYNATANVLPGLHLSILTDVTERERARKEIEEQGKRIENILESITDGFFTVDKNWTVKYWNKAAEKLLQLPREKILGKQLWDVYDEGLNDKSYGEYHRAMHEHIAVRFEDYFAGLNRWFDVSAYPATDGLTVYFKDVTSVKNQAIEILETKNNQAALINSSDDLIWSIDTEMKLVSFNTAYKKTIEMTSDIIVEEGMQLPFDYHGTAQQIQWKEYYSKGLRGEAFSVVISIENPKTGNTKHAEVSINPIFAIGTTTVKSVACYSHDITERLQYQSLIEAQNERLRANENHLKRVTGELEKVMNSSLDIICSMTEHGRFVQVSEASQYILGYTPDELMGRDYKQIIHPDYIRMTEEAVKEAMLGRPFTNLQNVYICKTGNEVPLIWSMRWDDEERIMFCVARDATSLVEAEKLKAESEQRFTTLVQKGADMVAIIDANGNYKYVSPNIQNIMGYDVEELLNKSALNLVHPDDLAFAVDELMKAATKNETEVLSYRFKNSAGEWRWIESIITNQLDNPAIKGLVINSRDITDRKTIETEREQMIKELLKSNADLKQFSFITSHNLRAPLSNIVGILHIINYPALDDYNRQMMEMIEASTKQLGQTIDDLAKILIIKNNVSIEITQISLRESIQEVNKVFLSSLNDLCADINIDFQVEEIFFNKTYFESIIINLLSNAIKYRSPHRSLAIRLSSRLDKNGNTIFQFSDNGSGMDVNMHKNKVFGLYQRFHDNTEGQGLGLFIIKSQIVALGGKIDVESEIDKGTTFTITFKKEAVAFVAEQ